MFNKIGLVVGTNPIASRTLTLTGRNGDGTAATVVLTSVASTPGANQFMVDGDHQTTLNNLAAAFNTAMAGKAAMTVTTGPLGLEITPTNTNRSSTGFFLGVLSGTGELSAAPTYSAVADTTRILASGASIFAGSAADTIDVFDASHLSSATIDGGAGSDVIYVVGDGTVLLGAGTSLTDVEEIVFNPNAATKFLDLNSIADLDSLTTLNLAGGTIRIQSSSSGMVDFSSKILVDVGQIARFTTNAGAIQAPAGFTGKITGSAVAETLLGGSGGETIVGNGGGDSIFGAGGADSIYGDGGDDTIRGGVNHDLVDGGADNDLILINSGDYTSFDTVYGGTGTDTIQFDSTVLDLGGTTVTGIEHIVGTLASGNRINLGATTHFSSVTHYTGGAGTDTIGVFNGHADFTGKTLTSIEVLHLMTANNVMTMPSGIALTGRGDNGDDVIIASLTDVAAGTQIFDFQGGTDTLRLSGGGTIDFTGKAFFSQLERVEMQGAGAYTLTANDANPALYFGGLGADSLRGGAVADTLQGADGNDTLVASAGADRFDGGNNDDLIVFGVGDIAPTETVDGGPGTIDVLRFNDPSALIANFTLSNIERIETTANNATLQLLGTQLVGVNKIHMQGTGTQTLSVQGPVINLSPLILDGVTKVVAGSSPSTITLPPGTTLTAAGSLGDDTFSMTLAHLAGNTVAVALDAGLDRVVLTGGGTIDLSTLTTFTGVEQVLVLGAINYTVQGDSAASRTYLAESGNDKITGGTLADTMFGGTGGDTLIGAAGDDVLVGELGTNDLRGLVGDDRLFGGADADVLAGGDDNDTLVGGDQMDTVRGEAGNDLLFGDAGADTLDGGDDTDTLVGGANADSLVGGAGADTLFGGTENDTLDGGGDTAVDLLIGGDGSDVLWGRANDVLWGGFGTDTFSVMTVGAITIADFAAGDLIDLTALSGTYTGAAALTLIGTPLVRSNGITYTFLHGGNTVTLNIVSNPVLTGLSVGDFL